ncbi:MAG: hypothetical protein V3R81_13390, partial [Gammaproteobacteria bacterium]
MVVALMGMGGVVIVGFTQQAREALEVQRYQHNQRVLQEAKQALLMFAYNYPQTNTNGIGPGRLPCPDVDNNGSVDGPGTCAQVGRFPWADDRLGTPELLDASGEKLWYAVSDAFDNIAGGGVINYGTSGTITLVDQSGGIIYDGDGAGIAAVIIAPGTILKRDEDANGTYEFTQLRNTTGIGGQQRDPRNYLDTFDGFDNSVFTNGQSDTNDDGFIMGPITDITQSTIVVNDQLIIVTADEVIAMAEKAVLAAYRDAIEDYLDKVACTGESPEGIGTTEPLCVANGGVWDPVYPWLYNYKDVADIAGLSSYYPATASFADEVDPITGYLGNVGRIPAIFGEYFGDGDTQKIDSKLTGEFEFDFSTLGGVTSSGHGTFNFDSEVLAQAFVDNNLATDVGFEDIDGGAGQEARFTATLANPLVVSKELYFWAEDDSVTNWFYCQDDGDEVPEVEDCHRNAAGVPQPGGANDNKEHILRVALLFSIAAGPMNIDTDHATNPPTNLLVTSPSTGGSHARIQDKYDLTNVLVSGNMPAAVTVSATYQFADHYHQGPSEVW